jgi:hypothetical protein
MVEATFAGDHRIKGKAEPQKTYRLNAIRHGATRFEAAVSRGLSTFVGRERELEMLERGLEKAHSQLCVVDLVAEPGMGKSRLLHEFRQRIGKERAFILLGNCSPDGQQTPFLPFIEVVRGSFQVSTGEAENEIARKLEMGLTVLGLHSLRNLGLLLHLLGLKVPDGALTGLDGVLIGLRTRELLQQLLEARCRLSPVVMLIEDLHWIDSVSVELLAKIIDSEARLRLLLLITRRPEYVPPWLDRATVTKLPLEPLPTGDIRHLVQARLGVEALPEALARQVTEKAEGNPLFAEEIITFLAERGILRTVAGKLEFDASAVEVALPASVQGVLTARADRLASKDRALLQAASVIGRRFDPQLLAGAVGQTDIDDRLAAMHTLDLVLPEGKSGDYAFKHALVRDALYQSLLTEPRKTLHLKIAEEVERRSGNRLIEMAEGLAHHYSQTDKVDKAFAYFSMSGSKSLSVYSLEQAASHFGAALALLDKNPDCASDDQFAEFLVSFMLLLNMSGKVNAMINILERYSARVDRLGDDYRAVLIKHHHVLALFWNTRYREAAAVQRELLPMMARVGDSRSKAYGLANEILVSTGTIFAKPLHEFEMLKKETMKAVSDTTDAYIQNWSRLLIGWQEIIRGRVNEARDAARELIRHGSSIDDPRSTGLGLWLLSWIALFADSYVEALEYSEQSSAVAITPLDRYVPIVAKGCALVLLRRTGEGATVLQEARGHCVADGYLYLVSGIDPMLGVCRVLRGDISAGIHMLEELILQEERKGFLNGADWIRFYLSDILLQIISKNDRVPLTTLLKNLPILLKVIATGSSRITTLMTRVLDNPQFADGAFVGRAQMILGLLYKTKKKRALALQHLTEAQRIISQFGQTPILARINAALAELG